MNSLLSLWRRVWPVLRIPCFIGVGLLVGFAVPYTLMLDREVRASFDDLVFAVPTRVYARPLQLSPGLAMDAATLELQLTFAGYLRGDGQTPGTWVRQGSRYQISSRGYNGPDGAVPAQRVSLALSGGRIASLAAAGTGQALPAAHLDPARIATVYGASQEERRMLRLADVPPLLLSGLQAVEDRDFKHHHGVDPMAILRAVFANLRAGHTVQGGSTLTQQLVRNLYLSRTQTFSRKLNEALMSVLLESHYSKARILEAYVNDVFLGQQGGQAVHGFAAASEFYFGQRVEALPAQDMALLIGMVKGPSYYDPRRYPERALQRRNVVLQEFVATGLLNAAQAHAAAAQPLGVVPGGQLPHNRFPAFMQLVRAQLTHDFDEATLRQGNLSIFTTLDPATQLDTEQAVSSTLASMGRRGQATQAAAVVTDIASSSVLAMVGSKQPGDQGFNRAMDARRPIGSLIKPFVYLVALTQPDRWNLSTPLDDGPISLQQPDGSQWTPQNDDNESHGQVPMVDALAHSWNLATVHLGLAIGVSRVQAFLQSFGLGKVNAGPSLLLGAVDLAPLQVAQMYQYIADDGYATQLMAVSAVLDGDGSVLKRYQVRSGQGQYQPAVRLIRWAMQQVTQVGTAHAIGESGLAGLHAAGKTGTSDSQRDSWFAGFTGQHLAVFWMGRDDNRPTGLWGASGSLKAWMALFRRLPTTALPQEPGQGLEMAWVDPASGKRTDPQCSGARQLPFVIGYLGQDTEGCFWQHVENFFGGGSAPSDPAPATADSTSRD
ncbi:penicillin-binding protein 1B [Frateuria aurantia]